MPPLTSAVELAPSPAGGVCDYDRETYTHVLVCVGPPAEKTRLDEFRSFGYWDARDPLYGGVDERATYRRFAAGPLAPGYRDAVPGQPCRVLISGAGDGGLADFIRLKTGIADVMAMLRALDARFCFANSTWLRVHDAFSHARRSGNIGGGVPLHDVLLDAQRGLFDLATQMLAASGVRDLLEEWIAPRAHVAVQVALPCWHFGDSFFANRMLAHLIGRAIAAKGLRYNGGLAPFRNGCRLDKLRCVGGACDGVSAHRSAGHAHDALFVAAQCTGCPPVSPDFMDACRALGTLEASPLSPCRFDRVLLRGGVSNDLGVALPPWLLPAAFATREYWDPHPNHAP